MWDNGGFDYYGMGVGPDYEGMILARQEAYDDCPGDCCHCYYADVCDYYEDGGVFVKPRWKIKLDGCWVCEQTGRDDCQKCGACPHPVEKTCFNCYYERVCRLQEVTVDEVQR